MKKKLGVKFVKMEYDDMIDFEIHERRFHETSDEQKWDSCDYKVDNEATIERHRKSRDY